MSHRSKKEKVKAIEDSKQYFLSSEIHKEIRAREREREEVGSGKERKEGKKDKRVMAAQEIN